MGQEWKEVTGISGDGGEKSKRRHIKGTQRTSKGETSKEETEVIPKVHSPSKPFSSFQFLLLENPSLVV